MSGRPLSLALRPRPCDVGAPLVFSTLSFRLWRGEAIPIRHQARSDNCRVTGCSVNAQGSLSRGSHRRGRRHGTFLRQLA